MGEPSLHLVLACIGVGKFSLRCVLVRTSVRNPPPPASLCADVQGVRKHSVHPKLVRTRVWKLSPFTLSAGLLKTPPTDPCGQVGSSLIKGCFFPRFSAIFCGFSEENIVFVLHYDLKCIFEDI